jgi:hypothetical protein
MFHCHLRTVEALDIILQLLYRELALGLAQRLQGVRMADICDTHRKFANMPLHTDTPTPFTQFTTYRAVPSQPVLLASGQTAAPSTYSAAKSYTASPTTGSSQASTSPPVPTTAASSSKLSTGAKIGIGVGVGVGACLLAIWAFFFVKAMKKRRERRSLQSEQFQGQYGQGPPSTYHSQDPSMSYYPQTPAMLNYPGGATPSVASHWGQYPTHTGTMGQQFKGPDGPSPVELATDNETNVHEIGSDVTAASPSMSSPEIR